MSTKIGISLPEEDFEKIERVRKKLGVNRSKLIDRAINFWFENRNREEKIKEYQEGYKRKPESLEETEALEEASAEAFQEEGWK